MSSLESIQLNNNDFYNPKYKIGFILEKYKNYSDQSLKSIRNNFKAITSVEKQKEKDVAFFSFDELKCLFEENKWLSPAVIENRKSMIREYMKWYRQKQLENWQNCIISSTIDKIGHKELSSESVYEEEFFRSFNELQSEIDVVYDAYSGVDDRELDLTVSAINLAWAGVDSGEVIKLQKCNVSMTLNQIYLPISNRIIDLDSKPMEFIREYLLSDGYTIVRTGNLAFCPYKESQYLLRSVRQEYLTENNLRSNLYRFSIQYEESGKRRRFKYDKILLSGVFSRLMKYEKQNGILTTKDVSVFEKFFNITLAAHDVGMAKFYRLFKEYKKYTEYSYTD